MILILKISFGSAIGCVWPKLYNYDIDTSVLRTHTYKVWSIVYLESCDATHTHNVRTRGRSIKRH